MNIRKAYRIWKPNLRRNGLREDSAVGRWLVGYEVIGRDDLHEITINESNITLGSLRNMIGQAPIPEWEHEQPQCDAVRLYDFFPATEHYDQGWVEINDKGREIAYDQSGII